MMIIGLVLMGISILSIVSGFKRIGKTVNQVKSFTDKLYNNDVDSLYGQPAEINSTITHNETNSNNNIN